MYSAEAKNDSNKDALSTPTLFRAKNKFQRRKKYPNFDNIKLSKLAIENHNKKIKKAFIIAAFLHKHTIQVAYNNYAYAK